MTGIETRTRPRSPAGSVRLLSPVLSRIATHPVEMILSLGMEETRRKLLELLALEAAINAQRPSLVDQIFVLIPLVEPAQRGKLLNLKRHLYARWEPIEDGLLQCLVSLSPPLSSPLSHWNSLARKRLSLQESCRAAYGEEFRVKRARLRDILLTPLVQEGILLASQELHAAVKKQLAASEGSSEEKEDGRNLESSVVEHLTRACCKPTPRSVLTGLVLGAPAAAAGRSDITQRLAGVGRIGRRKTLLAWPQVREIARTLSRQGQAWRYVVPRPNPTWRRQRGHIIFWRRDAKEEVHCRVPRHPLIEAFLDLTQRRRLRAEEIIDRICAEYKADYSRAEIEDRYHALCGLGLLIGHLEIPFIEIDGLNYLIGWMEVLPEEAKDEQALLSLLRIRQLIEALDGAASPQRDGSWEALYQDVQNELKALLPGQPLPVAKSLVVDCVGPWSPLQLDAELCETLGRTIEILQRLGEQGSAGRATVSERMLSRLTARFPRKSSLPLLEFYDCKSEEDYLDCGNGDAAENPAPHAPAPLELLTRWIQEREREAGSPIHEMQLSRQKLEELVPRRSEKGLDGSGCLLFHLQATSQADVLSGNYQIICHDVWPNPLSISRWFHAFGDDSQRPKLALSEFVRQLVRRNKQTLLAPAIYGYDLLTDTAGWHPSYFDHEIELTSVRSHLPASSILPLKDLYLRWNKGSGRVGLYWRTRRRWKQVTPVVASSLQTRQDAWMELIRILSSTNTCSSHIHAFKFTRHPPPVGHLPRIVIDGKIVLLRELWCFQRTEMPDIGQRSEWELFELFNRWQLQKGLPRFVFVTWFPKGGASLERPFMIDFQNPFHLRTLASYLRRSSAMDRFAVQEMLPGPGQLWTGEPQSHHTHELVAPFHWSNRK